MSFNRAVVVNLEGEIIGRYRKVDNPALGGLEKIYYPASARDGHHIIPGLSWIADPFGNVVATAFGERGDIVLADPEKVKIEEGQARYPTYRDRRPALYRTICTPMEDLY